ncbi:MAG: hypothetical protein JNM50_02820 [Chromatiales bacterium]|nr:hypothetical protein [Chromatiales bacterium]
MRLLRLLLIAAGLAVLAGCATTTSVSSINKLEARTDRPRILLLAPDVKFYALTASGIPEAQADWTEAARVNFAKAIVAEAEARNADLVVRDGQLTELESRYSRLHGAVGETVLVNHFVQKLPAKGGRFDWSLGPGVQELRESSDADYVLFTYYRDSRATGGRVAMFVVVAALTGGAAIPMGGQGGFASLVDLKTGDIVWFNKVDAGTGDLRDPDSAKKVVANLVKDLPKN